MAITSLLAVFPTPNPIRTAEYYVEMLGFRRVDYLGAKQKHICLYRDSIEIILTDSNGRRVIPNRELYGEGEDAYLITGEQEALYRELSEKGADIIKPLELKDYGNYEFTIRDIDGRTLAFGRKQWEKMSDDRMWAELYSRAKKRIQPRRVSPFIEAGAVAAALVTKKGSIYEGVCIDTASTLGMCAERNAIANMLTNGESDIEKIVAVMEDGSVGAPCGACREFMMQLSPESGNIEILMDYETKRTVPLSELIPEWWGDGIMKGK